jgi:hypothetical protein
MDIFPEYHEDIIILQTFVPKYDYMRRAQKTNWCNLEINTCLECIFSFFVYIMYGPIMASNLHGYSRIFNHKKGEK